MSLLVGILLLLLTSSADWELTTTEDLSVARVTLEVPPESQQVFVIRDFRQHTVVGALASIGGLLSVFQGFHLLCFGRPLFWGLFGPFLLSFISNSIYLTSFDASGSKLLDPFGIFGSFSVDLRKRMVEEYGFIPDVESSGARGLGLFLSDLVMDVGPLERKDEDDSNGGQPDTMGSNANIV